MVPCSFFYLAFPVLLDSESVVAGGRRGVILGSGLTIMALFVAS
jgi:hypothetical protein